MITASDMGAALDLTGHRFGRLVAISLAGVVNRCRKWTCKCDCGNECAVAVGSLRSGNAKSCGCYHRQRASEATIRHGCGRKGKRTAEYGIWRNIKTRCSNPRFPRFADYGGRGIKVCDRWESFENFLADMGERPSPKHSIDRINNDGDYEPGNCRWATPVQQRRNQPRYKMTADLVNEIRGRVEHGESKQSIARRLGFSRSYVGDIVARKYWSELP